MSRSSPFLLLLTVTCTLLVCWEGVSRLFALPLWLLPPPSTVALEFVKSGPSLLSGLLHTSLHAAVGLVAAFGFAVIVVAAAVRWPRVDGLIAALFAGSQSVPIIAIAPLLTLWFGTGMGAKAATAFLLCVAPISVNWLAGLRSVDPEEKQLFKLWGARWTQEFRYLVLPDSMPYLLAGLRIGAPLALIGAIVGEFVGARNGLGFIIMTSSYYARTPVMLAATVMCVVAGAACYALIRAAELRVMRWRTVGKNVESPTVLVSQEQP
jgi:ABC-type nitrate/sulfonate/bicarbonate transport system permease component